MRVHLIHNPTAGTGDCPGRELRHLLSDAGFDVRYSSSKDHDLGDQLAEPADMLVAAGGDGTIGKVLSLMPDRSIPVAVLPLGSSNNVARSLGIGGPLTEIVAGLRTARRQRFDVGVAIGPWGRRCFVESFGCGALAAANDRTGDDVEGAERLQRGREAFRRQIEEEEPLEAAVAIDGQSLSGRWLLIEAANTRLTGPRLMLSPAADPGDGALDILCVSEDQRAAVRDWLSDPERKELPVTPVRGQCLRMQWGGGRRLRIDDTLCAPPPDGAEALVTATLQDVPVHILVPHRQHADASQERGGGVAETDG